MLRQLGEREERKKAGEEAQKPRGERPLSASDRLTSPGLDGEFEIDPADFIDPAEFNYRRGINDWRP